jgi:hypothetical protein
MIDLNVMATNIKDKLAKVPGIKQAYDYEPQSMTQFPAATIYFDGFGQDEETTRRSSFDWRWTIRLYTPINVSDIKIPQTEIRKLVQETINHMRKDVTINNSCFYHTISNGEVFAVLDQNNPYMIAELQLVATTES